MGKFRILCLKPKPRHNESTWGDSDGVHSSSSVVTALSEDLEGVWCSWIRRRVLRVLESPIVRVFIVVLVFIDIMAISFEIAIGQGLFGEVEREVATCPTELFNSTLPWDQQPKEVAPRIRHITDRRLKNVEEGLHILSISLLSVFLCEILLSIAVIGPKWFCNVLHIFDMAVVLTAFFIEILVKRDAIVGVIVVLRLIRIIQGVIDSERQSHANTVLAYHRAANMSCYLRRLLREATSSKGLSPESEARAEYLLRPVRDFCRKDYKEMFDEEWGGEPGRGFTGRSGDGSGSASFGTSYEGPYYAELSGSGYRSAIGSS